MLSLEIRQAIKKLRKEGKSYGQISEILDIPKTSVFNVCMKTLKLFKKKTGPKQCISNRMKTRITKYINDANKRECKVNCNKIIKDLDLKVERRTLNNWLLRKDYIYTNCPKKIFLTSTHKTNRICHAKDCLEKNIDWMKTVFTDEKAFSLDGPYNW